MTRSARIVLFFFVLALPAVVSGTTWYVDASVSPGGDGSSWDRALLTIGEAVACATDGDTVLVAPGRYREDSLWVLKSITLQSTDPDDPSVVAATVIEETTVHYPYVLEGFAIRGGRISCSYTTIAITNNIISGGEGIYCTTSSAIISGNLIFNNFKAYGGGIDCFHSRDTIINNVIANNSAAYHGGAIYCRGASPLIANNTIVGNIVKRDATTRNSGGICRVEEPYPAIRNCILWDNGDDLFNCSATYSCVQDADPGEGNISFYPHFVDPAGGDYRLYSWSPCIDAGDPSSPFLLEPEPNGGCINMGAYGNTPEAASVSPDMGADGLPDDWEILHFGHLDYDGMDDPDRDDILNVDEYGFGWNPAAASLAPVHNLTAGRSYQNIQPAIVAAGPGDEIVVDPGVYLETVGFLGKAVVLRSLAPSDADTVASTIIDGGCLDSVVTFASGEGRDSVLSGFTITGGRASLGGGIYCLRSSPTICFNVITRNAAPESYKGAGGGVYSYGGSPVLKGNRVQKNTAFHGGGICIEAGEVGVADNVIAYNHADGSGGGIYLSLCRPGIMERNWIEGNSSIVGGGLYLGESPVWIKNNLILENRARIGGGVYYKSGRPMAVNNTIAWNFAEEGGGIYRDHGGAPGIVANCIFWENADDLHNLQASYSRIQGRYPGERNIHVDPGFMDPENGDYRLRADSPCRNVGNTAAALDVRLSLTEDGALISWWVGDDLDGNPRISGTSVDMGAYEYPEGPANLQFLLEYSSDLMSWESIEVGAAWQWTDDLLDGVTARFYRIRLPEP